MYASRMMPIIITVESNKIKMCFVSKHYPPVKAFGAEVEQTNGLIITSSEGRVRILLKLNTIITNPDLSIISII